MFDRVLVLGSTPAGSGQILEIGDPRKLSKDLTSHLSSFIDAAGTSEAASLRAQIDALGPPAATGKGTKYRDGDDARATSPKVAGEADPRSNQKLRADDEGKVAKTHSRNESRKDKPIQKSDDKEKSEKVGAQEEKSEQEKDNDSSHDSHTKHKSKHRATKHSSKSKSGSGSGSASDSGSGSGSYSGSDSHSGASHDLSEVVGAYDDL